MRRVPGLVLLASCLALLSPSPAGAAHPFYERLLGDGVAALELGDAETAARNLELAAFGFLDEPPLLARALVHLAIARVELGDDEAFRETLTRLVEIEERFGGYGQAEIPPAVRTDFETRILSSAARELEQGRSSVARQRAGVLLTLAPGSTPARCLQGRAAAVDGDCDDAVSDVSACETAPTEPAVLRGLLACHVEREEWREARELAAGLPRELRRDRSFAPLLERVEAAPEPGPETVPPPLPSSDPQRLTQEERDETLQRARAQLEAARTVGDLDQALELTGRVADANPADVEAQLLAGEIAYRASRWEDAVLYFDRAGDLEDAPPEVLFFFAVSLYETNRQERARSALERALPDLARTPFVNRYVDMILSPKM